MLLIEKLIQFRDQRNWQQFHKPSNLSKSIIIEAAELLEHFQWQDNNYNLEEVKGEIADIYIYLSFLAYELDLNLDDIALEKMLLNEERFPINFEQDNLSKDI